MKVTIPEAAIKAAETALNHGKTVELKVEHGTVVVIEITRKLNKVEQ